MALLILNAGSSTLKFSVMDADADRVWAEGSFDASSRPARYTWRADGATPHEETVTWSHFAPAVQRVVSDARALVGAAPGAAIDGVAHRVVHGGTRFTEPVRITADVRAALAGLIELAPLHNPPSLDAIDAAMEALPEVPHVAVFDTAFHATLAPVAFTYPLPAAWNDRWGLRRFGFHGLSHAYCAARAAELLGREPDGFRVVIAHLGNGASVTAVKDGRSVDTSMGFTPMEGLMMGTRSGSIDPGLLLHLQLQCGVSADELHRVLNRESGLIGLSGVSSDMREIVDAANAGNARAALAVQVFAHRARQTIGALAVTLGGVDALVFTAGIGEHSAQVRAAICDGLSCLGLDLDADANASAHPDAVISTGASRGSILVLATREDLMMARAAAPYLRSADRAPTP